MMHDHRLERLTFFSDAVFAIAMTVLVIELHVPEFAGRSDVDFLNALLHQTGSFIAFAVSFLAIGAFWVHHHRSFGLVARYDPHLAWRNIFMLLAIVFVPFASAFMSDYFGHRVPHMLYMGVLLAAGLLQCRLVGTALRPDLLADDVDRRTAERMRRRSWAVVLAAGLALLVAIWLPGPSVAVLLTMPLFVRLLERSVRG